MSKSRRLLVGLLSIMPLLLTIVYMIFFFSLFFSLFASGRQPEAFPPMIMEHMLQIVGIGMLMGLLSLVQLIYFIIHAVNNASIDSTERVIWILAFVFAGIISCPIYWWLRIRVTPVAATD